MAPARAVCTAVLLSKASLLTPLDWKNRSSD
ncbi:hypothetical protein SMCF_7982 [Streptomyces coelicoflavus ZG0656]|nr:hypothetical protein SMCF_7982 [Streptomyces coelicoflavus ZG0656]